MSAAVHETMFQPEMHLYCIQYVPGQGYQRHPDSSRKWKFKWIELYMGIYAWKVKVNHLELSRAQSASLEDLTAAPAEKVKSASSCDQYSNQYFVSVVNYSPSNWCWVQKVGQYTIYIVHMLYILVTSSDISVSSSRKVIDDNKPCKYDFILRMSPSQQGSGYGEIPHQIGLTLKILLGQRISPWVVLILDWFNSQ